jgi:PLP dependent protein
MTDAEIRTRLQDRLHAVDEHISAACHRAGRMRSGVTMVAVTKTVSVRVARLLAELGALDLGENRPQELWRKAAELKDLPIRWHMIGHLQRNKVERTIPLAHLIHAVDSSRLLEEIDKQAGIRRIQDNQLPVRVLLEVNASREENKHGIAPETIPEMIASLERYSNVRVEGFMTMAALADDPDHARPAFAEVRRLRERFALAQLSMGMSNDFEVAIEEGATLIRLGTVLFEGLERLATEVGT